MNVEGLGSLQLLIRFVPTGDELGTQCLSVGTLDPYLPYIKVNMELVTDGQVDLVELLGPKCSEHPSHDSCCLGVIETLGRHGAYRLTMHFQKPPREEFVTPEPTFLVLMAGACLSRLI